MKWAIALYLLISVFISLFSVALYARDNPFEKQIEDSVDNKPFSNIYLDEERLFLPSQAREITSVTIEYKTLDGSKERKTIQLNSAIDPRLPVIVKQNSRDRLKAKNSPGVEFIPFRFIKYRIEPNIIYIYTDQEKLRHFHLPRPFKIVIDFDSKLRFKTLKKELNVGRVKVITTGAHKGFFRVSISLDATYRYTIHKISQGYKIILK